MKNKNGFTLIEVIIIMVIVGILAAIVLLSDPFSSIKLDSAVRKVAADIRYAQKLAVSTQTRAGIEFTGNGYCVFSDITLRTGTCAPANSLARSPGDPCSDNGAGNFAVDFTAPRCSNYNGVGISTMLPSSIVKFNSLGIPYGGDDNLLSAPNNTVTLAVAGVPSKAITIEPNTGQVSY